MFDSDTNWANVDPDITFIDGLAFAHTADPPDPAGHGFGMSMTTTNIGVGPPVNPVTMEFLNNAPCFTGHFGNLPVVGVADFPITVVA